MRSFLFLATGFEELEALTVVDVLRRGGMDIKTVSIRSERQVTGAHGITVEADMTFKEADFEGAEWLILPGGMPGAQNLHDFAPLQGLLKRQAQSQEGRIAAICAAPAVVLGELGLLEGHEATCYPGFESKMRGAKVVDRPVVTDSKFVLGNGPSNALDWALTIVAVTKGNSDAENVASAMLRYTLANQDIVNFFG